MGCTVTLEKRELCGQPGGMLSLRMDQPGDGRGVEVWLEREALEALRIALVYWDYPVDIPRQMWEEP